jgi:hypothetical protein
MMRPAQGFHPRPRWRFRTWKRFNEPLRRPFARRTLRHIEAAGRAPMLLDSRIDTDFAASEGAFYYARVLVIPTPRWSTYDAVRNNLPLLEDVPATI